MLHSEQKIDFWVTYCEHIWWYIHIGSGNGLLPDGNKPLPEPMVTNGALSCSMEQKSSFSHMKMETIKYFRKFV